MGKLDPMVSFLTTKYKKHIKKIKSIDVKKKDEKEAIVVLLLNGTNQENYKMNLSFHRLAAH